MEARSWPIARWSFGCANDSVIVVGAGEAERSFELTSPQIPERDRNN